MRDSGSGSKTIIAKNDHSSRLSGWHPWGIDERQGVKEEILECRGYQAYT